MANSWEDSKKKRSPIGLIALLVIIVIGIGFLIYNNRDIFPAGKAVPKTGRAKAKSLDDRKADIPVVPAGPTEGNNSNKGDRREQKVSSSDTVKGKAEISEDAASAVFSLDLPPILCTLADKQGLSIRVSLKLYFREKELEREILFKRDAIKLIVKKVFAEKHLSDIVVDMLRAELQKEINALLEQGAIIDIEFLDFKPGEV
jgi:flagellar basal body-associated protein FliL